MPGFARLLVFIAVLATCLAAGWLALNSREATAALPQQAPPPCACSALEKLEYKPVSPAEPVSRLYVGHCQCGALSCVVTAGALQCTK